MDTPQDTVGDVADNVKDRDVVAQAEELAESEAAEGGTVGMTADEPDDVIR